MKKLLLTTLISIFAFALSNRTEAQNIGGGLAYGTEVEELGLGVFAQFPTANSDLIIAPSFVYFFADDPLNFWEFNANINYVFSESSATVYGILGLNIARVGRDDIDLGVLGTLEGSSDTELGLNIGAGVDLNIGSSVTPFFETKYAISDFDQLVIYAGVRFPF